MRLSVLDLVPVRADQSTADALAATIRLAGTITAVANLDFFHDAKKVAQDHNAELTHFVVSPAVALQIAKIKQLSTGSNQSLLADVADGTLLAGLPVLVSPAVDASTFAFGLDASQIFTVLRQGTKVVKSSESAFDNDAVQVRVTARVGFGFANPAGLIRLYDAA